MPLTDRETSLTNPETRLAEGLPISRVKRLATNNDPGSAALLQIEWVSVQVDTTKWLAYRNNIRAWSKLLGVQE